MKILVHYVGIQSNTYHWVAAPGTSGAWPYHDHTFSINEVGAEELRSIWHSN